MRKSPAWFQAPGVWPLTDRKLRGAGLLEDRAGLEATRSWGRLWLDVTCSLSLTSQEDEGSRPTREDQVEGTPRSEVSQKQRE